MTDPERRTTGAVPAGPFDGQPADLFPTVGFTPDGTARAGDQVTDATAAWLASVLDFAGVDLGAFDREVLRLIADEGWPTAQAVAGWVLRARPTSTPSRRPKPPLDTG